MELLLNIYGMNKIVLFITLLLLPYQCWSADQTETSQYSPLNQQQTTTEYNPLNLKTEQLQKRESEIIAKGSLERTQQEEVIASKERNLQYQLQKEAIKKRIENYIRQGALPPHPPSSVTINGKKYPSYHVFLDSTDGRNWLAWQRAKHEWEEQKKKIDAEYAARLRKESFKKLVEYEKLPWNEKRNLESRKRVEAYMGSPGPWMRESVYIPPQKKSQAGFIEELNDRLRKADAETDKYINELNSRTEFSEQ